MNRDSLIIQRKLLDAFIPVLNKQESSNPFRSKELSNTQLAYSQVSLSRQIYISSEQKLEEQSLKCSRTSIGSQSKTKSRKYLKVYSQPHHQISSRDSSLVHSRAQTIINEQREGSAIQKTFQRSNRSKSLSSHDQRNILHDSRSILQKDASNSNIISNQSLSSSQQKVKEDNSYERIMRGSRILRTNIQTSSQMTRVNSLQKLIESENIVLKNQIISQASNNGCYKNIIYTQNPHLITQKNLVRGQIYPRHPNMSQLNSQILQNPPNIQCRPLFNGQPAFRTIIKKQLNSNQSNNIYQANKSNIENQITVQTLVRSDFDKNMLRGINDNLQAHSIFTKKLLVQPTNIRNQIVSQLLR